MDIHSRRGPFGGNAEQATLIAWRKCWCTLFKLLILINIHLFEIVSLIRRCWWVGGMDRRTDGRTLCSRSTKKLIDLITKRNAVNLGDD